MSNDHRRKARAYKEELLRRLFKAKRPSRSRRWLSLGHYAPEHHNIIGVGFGRKYTKRNQITAPEAVTIYVRKKLPKGKVPLKDRIPSEINGHPTDVVAIGDIKFLSRPTPCGVSAAHFQAHAGTLGCLVRRVPDDGTEYILSNNHVFANANQGNTGDLILQPAAEDGGNSQASLARLSRRLRLLPAGNVADVATGALIFPGSVLSEIHGLDPINPQPVAPAKDLVVKKSGRSTGVTMGVVRDTEADIQVPMGGQIFGFVEQILVMGVGGPFARDGDSGALAVSTPGLQPVGLLFAGGANVAYLNPIMPILEQLQLRIV